VAIAAGLLGGVAETFDTSHATAHRKYEAGIEQLRGAMTTVDDDKQPVSKIL